MSAPAIGPSASPASPSESVSVGRHLFRLRPTRLSDMEDLRELARHTYEGFDYICHKLPHWMNHPDDFVCIAIVYEGMEDEEQAATATDRGVPLTDLRRPAAPIPPDSYLTLPSGELWQHELVSLRPRPPAALASSPSPTSQAGPDDDSARAHRKLSPPLDGQADDRWIAPSPPCIAPLASFVHHVVSIEVLCLFDDRQSGFLQALRVHPAARGFGLSSLIHERMLSVAANVYHVKRVRETTSGGNKISLHLGAKHGLHPVRAYECGFFNRDQLRETLAQAERQLEYLGTPPTAIDLNLATGVVRRGTSTDVLELVARHPADESLNMLRAYWMLYGVTENNLVYLCTEAVLPSGDASQRRNLSAIDPQRPDQLLCATETPYFLTTAGDAAQSDEEGAFVRSVDAFGISLTSKDHSGNFRTFSLYSPTPAGVGKGNAVDGEQEVWRSREYQRMLQLWVYQLRAARDQRHETAAFRFDSTGRPVPCTEFTIDRYADPILNVQSSTPTWFSATWQQLQRKIDADQKAAGDTPKTIATSTDGAGSDVTLAPTSRSAWMPECQMMVLEKEFVNSNE